MSPEQSLSQEFEYHMIHGCFELALDQFGIERHNELKSTQLIYKGVEKTTYVRIEECPTPFQLDRSDSCIGSVDLSEVNITYPIIILEIGVEENDGTPSLCTTPYGDLPHEVITPDRKIVTFSSCYILDSNSHIYRADAVIETEAESLEAELYEFGEIESDYAHIDFSPSASDSQVSIINKKDKGKLAIVLRDLFSNLYSVHQSKGDLRIKGALSRN